MALLASAGTLQWLELKAFDDLLFHRPSADNHDRVVLIDETEEDIRRYGHPLNDQLLAEALSLMGRAGARVIGVDKYRDVAVPPGTDALNTVLQQNPKIIWIFFAANTNQEFIQAPAILRDDPERIGFNDIEEDPDGVARRGLLYLDLNDQSYNAFSLLLSLHYLAAEQVFGQADENDHLSFNGISFPRITSTFGGYSQIDAAGYQIVLDYPGLPGGFRTFSLSELLDGKLPPDALRDKLVIFGSSAHSLHDYRLMPNETHGFGFQYHAYVASQILNSALNQKQPFRDWSNIIEYVSLFICCLLGALTGLRRGSLRRLILFIVAEITLFLVFVQLLFNMGWWLPSIMLALGWATAFALSVLFFFRKERAERRQLMQLFASHVSPEVANRLWEAREQFFNEGGVRPDTLTATVLFTDLSNFTTIAETMEPLVLMNWLNQYMEEMSKIVIDHGGIINKYIGDAIMAIFGVPVKRNAELEVAEDALHAVRCAQQFNQRLKELNQQWQKRGLPTITMRTGIQTGMLVAGSFGGSLRMEYTVIGDTVNTASRLESFDKTVVPPTEQQPCRILIGESTHQYVKQHCETQWVSDCQLKGKTQQLRIYQVLNK